MSVNQAKAAGLDLGSNAVGELLANVFEQMKSGNKPNISKSVLDTLSKLVDVSPAAGSRIDYIGTGGSGKINEAALAKAMAPPTASQGLDILQSMVADDTQKYGQMIAAANKESYAKNGFNNSLSEIPEGMDVGDWAQMQELISQMKASTLSQMNKDKAIQTLMDELAREEGLGTEQMIEQMAKELIGLDVPDATALKGGALEAINRAASAASREAKAAAAKGGGLASSGLARILSSTLVNAAGELARTNADIDVKNAEAKANIKIARVNAYLALTDGARSFRRQTMQAIASILANPGQDFVAQ